MQCTSLAGKDVYWNYICLEKDIVFEIINNNTGLALDVACGDGAKEGTTADGKQGRCLFRS